MVGVTGEGELYHKWLYKTFNKTYQGAILTGLLKERMLKIGLFLGRVEFSALVVISWRIFLSYVNTVCTRTFSRWPLLICR